MQGLSLVTDGYIVPIHPGYAVLPTFTATVEVRPKLRRRSPEGLPPDPGDHPAILSSKEVKPVIVSASGPAPVSADGLKPEVLSGEELRPVIKKSEEK